MTCTHPDGRVYVNNFNRFVTCAECRKVRWQDGTWHAPIPNEPSPFYPATQAEQNEILASIGYGPYRDGPYPSYLQAPFAEAGRFSAADDPRDHLLGSWYWHQRQVSGIYSFGSFHYWEAHRLRLLYALFAKPYRRIRGWTQLSAIYSPC